MRILITGASGLLGVNLALEMSKKHRVFGQVNSTILRTKVFTVIQKDLLETNAVERLLDSTQPDWVIHCAALANLDACQADPARAKKLNTDLPRQLAFYVARGGARLVHVSTDAVFDGKDGNYTEEDKPNPLSVYAKTKLEGERAVLETNPEALIARVNLFGWSLNGNRSLAEFFYNSLNAGKRVMGFTDVFFCPLLANDLAKIFLRMLSLNLKGLFHVVSTNCISKYNFGVLIARQFGFNEKLITPSSVTQASLSAPRSNNLTLRNDKLRSIIGSIPLVEQGIQGFYDLFLQQYPQLLKRLGVTSTNHG